MDRLYCTVFVTLISYVTSITSGAPQETFLRANMLYNQQRYQDALQLYNTLNNKGPAVWYNMAKCSIALEQYGWARFFFEKAKYKASRKLYQAIVKNIEDIVSELSIPKYSCRLDDLMVSIYGVTHLFSTVFLQLFFLIIWISIMVAMRLVSMPRRLLMCILSLLLLVVGFLLVNRYYIQKRILAVVIVPEASVYTGPHEHYHEVEKLHEAMCVPIICKDGTWYNISVHCVPGWIQQDAVALVSGTSSI